MKTTRRLVSLLLFFCLFTGAIVVSAFAESVLVLPAAMEIIDEELFFGAKSLDRVVLSDHVKEIRSRAFAESTLSEINLPDSLSFIAEDAFDASESVSVTANEGTYAYQWAVDHGYIHPAPTLVEDFTFSDNGNGTCTITGYTGNESRIIIPDCNAEGVPVISIGENAFESSSGLISVMIPDGVISIGYAAFYECTELVRVTIPNSVTTIDSFAFSGCTSLTSVVIPNSVTSIGESAFDSCISLTSITISDSVTSIEKYTFYGCSSLTSITLPDSVTSIDSCAFEGCSSLTSITIPNGVASIDGYTFAGCSSLASISIPNGVTRIGDCAFYDCNNLTDVFFDGTQEQWDEIDIGSDNDSLLNASLKLYDDPLEPEDIEFWVGNFNFLYNGDGTCTLIFYSFDADETEITIPAVISIEEALFSDDVIVTGIGPRAFSNCSGLKRITIPEGIMSIGEQAFEDCTGLTSIEIPSSIIRIGDWAFQRCSNLISVTLPNGITSIPEGAFAGCSLTSITIPSSVTSIGSGAFSGCRLTSVIIPNGVTSIGDWAFSGCDALINVTFPDGLINIGKSAFADCINMIGIELPDSITTIGDSAFYCCNLTGITLPKSITMLGDKAFIYCRNLTSITIKNGVTSIGDSVFCCCNPVSIIIPKSVTSIGDNAFGACTSLASITIPCTVTSISETAFIVHNEELVIYGEAGSYAETFANDHDISFVAVTIPDDEEDTATVSGTVRTASGEAVPDVYVFAVNTADENDSAYALTNAKGEWRMTLTAGATYAFAYISMDYTVPGSTNTVSANLSLSAVAELPGEIDESLSFTMKQEGEVVDTIVVGTAVDFTVTAPEAKFVRLVVDGKAYEQHRIQDGVAQFTREFSVSGNREIKFHVWMDGDDDYSVFTPAQTLNVTCEDGHIMENANIHEIGAYVLNSGEPLTITWDPVPHAEDYTVYVYHDGCRYYPLDTDSKITRTGGETSFTFPDSYSLWVSDQWSAQVVTTGEGWDSSSSTAFFSVIATNALAQFTELPQGNTAMLGSSFAVTISSALTGTDLSLSVLPPQNGQSVDISDLGNGRYVVRADHPGTYTLQAFANGASEPVDQAEIIVAEPALSQFKQGAYSQYAWYVQGTSISFSVSANFIPDTVALLCDGIAVKTVDNTEAQGSFFTIADPNALNDLGRHTYTICATYGEYSVISERSFPVYVMSSNPDAGSTRYASVDTALYTYPGLSSGLTLPAHTPILACEGLYNDLMLIKYNLKEYFVLIDDLTSNVSVSSEPIIAIQPALASPTVVEINSNITYTVQTVEAVQNIVARITYLDSSLYNDEDLTGFVTSTVPYSQKSGNQYKFDLLFDNLGTYTIDFIPYNADNNALKATTFDVITYYRIHNNNSFYLQNIEKAYLSQYPYNMSNCYTYQIDWETPLEVIGTTGKAYYVKFIKEKNESNTSCYGFIRTDDLHYRKNPCTKRAYIIVSDSMASVKRTEDVSRNAYNEMSSLFRQYGYEIISGYNSCCTDFQRLLINITNTVDFNDITAIYIWSHGNDTESYVNGGIVFYNYFENDGYKIAFNYTEIANIYLPFIQGKVSLIIDACLSGQMIDAANASEELSYRTQDIAIISSTNNVESARFADFFEHYPIYTNEFFTKYKQGSNGSTGVNRVTLNDIRTDIPITHYQAGIIPTQCHPQYWPENDNIVIN